MHVAEHLSHEMALLREIGRDVLQGDLSIMVERAERFRKAAQRR